MAIRWGMRKMEVSIRPSAPKIPSVILLLTFGRGPVC